MKKKFGKALLAFIIGSLIIEGVTTVVDRLESGQDILGRARKRTTQNSQGDIVLGTEDYNIV